MNSIFDIIGPVMIGPSSSHTAGAARLGKLAAYILKEKPCIVDMILFGSFAKTYKGHGTDKALVAGLLGCEAEDERIPTAFAMTEEKKLLYSFTESEEDKGHPNAVEFHLTGESGRKTIVLGFSLGGGKVIVTEIDGMPVELTGEEHTLMTLHMDQPGVVHGVTEILARDHVNISGMRVFRKSKFTEAVMVITTDSPVAEDSLVEIQKMNCIKQVMAFAPVI